MRSLGRIRLFLMVAGFLLLAGMPARAVAWEGGGLTFVAGMEIGAPQDGLIHLRFLMLTSGDSTIARANVQLDSGLELVSGDTALTMRGNGEPASWGCALRGHRGGSYSIGALALARYDSISSESTKIRIIARLDSSGVATGSHARLWFHRRIGAQLYRIEGEYPVPIDDSDTLSSTVHAEVSRLVSRMRPIAPPGGRDSTVSALAMGTGAIRCTVCVDEHGFVTELTVIGERALDTRLHDAVLRWLRASWRFQPATTSSRIAPDCANVEVPVGPAARKP